MAEKIHYWFKATEEFFGMSGVQALFGSLTGRIILTVYMQLIAATLTTGGLLSSGGSGRLSCREVGRICGIPAWLVRPALRRLTRIRHLEWQPDGSILLTETAKYTCSVTDSALRMCRMRKKRRANNVTQG